MFSVTLSVQGLSLKESVSQFSNTMTAQTDLRVEAAHLRRCYNNFRRIRQNSTPPFPVPGYETAAVLVETFEPGRLSPPVHQQELPRRHHYNTSNAICYIVR